MPFLRSTVTASCLWALVCSSGIGQEVVTSAQQQVPQSSPSDTPLVVIPDAQVVLIRDVAVPAEATGRIQSLNVRESDRIEAGQSLAKIDDEVVKQMVTVAEAEFALASEESGRIARVEDATRRLELADESVARLKSLLDKSPTSVAYDDWLDARRMQIEAQAELRQATSELEQGRLAAKVKQATLAANVARLRRHEIVSPLPGIVIETMKQPGEWIEEGEPMFRIVDIARLRLETFLPSSLYDETLIGAVAQFEAELPGESQPVLFAGNVTFVSPIVEAVNGEVRVWVEVRNPEGRLRPGTIGKLSISASR